jgi:hypothetical protein
MQRPRRNTQSYALSQNAKSIRPIAMSGAETATGSQILMARTRIRGVRSFILNGGKLARHSE